MFAVVVMMWRIHFSSVNSSLAVCFFLIFVSAWVWAFILSFFSILSVNKNRPNFSIFPVKQNRVRLSLNVAEKTRRYFTILVQTVTRKWLFKNKKKTNSLSLVSPLPSGFTHRRRIKHRLTTVDRRLIVSVSLDNSCQCLFSL